MPNTPILFIIFNRPDSTKKVFEAIEQAKPSRLYIAADAPRTGNLNDEANCKPARAITENINWPCEVKRLYQKKNLGCGLAVSEAINWFFSQNEEGIILEDDCLPHPDFFIFASEMLDKFRDNKKIISINGSNLGYHLKDGNSYTFSRFMNMWGWATWKDRAGEIDYKITDWKNQNKPLFWLYKHLRQYLFDLDLNWYKFWGIKFDKVVEDEKFTWDWQWMYHQLKNRQLSVVPATNLVSNIGFDEDATHTIEINNPAANIPTAPMQFPFIHSVHIQPDFVYEEHFVKWVWCYQKRLPSTFYIKQFISTIIKGK